VLNGGGHWRARTSSPSRTGHDTRALLRQIHARLLFSRKENYKQTDVRSVVQGGVHVERFEAPFRNWSKSRTSPSPPRRNYDQRFVAAEAMLFMMTRAGTRFEVLGQWRMKVRFTAASLCGLTLMRTERLTFDLGDRPKTCS